MRVDPKLMKKNTKTSNKHDTLIKKRHLYIKLIM